MFLFTCGHAEKDSVTYKNIAEFIISLRKNPSKESIIVEKDFILFIICLQADDSFILIDREVFKSPIHVEFLFINISLGDEKDELQLRAVLIKFPDHGDMALCRFLIVPFKYRAGFREGFDELPEIFVLGNGRLAVAGRRFAVSMRE